MRLPFFRRKHQKLKAESEELPDLTRPPSEESSGSESVQSFDPNNYTVDDFISASAEAEERQETYNEQPVNPKGASSPDGLVAREPANVRRQWLSRRKARPLVEEKVPSTTRRTEVDTRASDGGNGAEPVKPAFSTRISQGFIVDQAEFDRAMGSAFRSSGTISEKSQSSSKTSSRKKVDGKNDKLDDDDNRSSRKGTSPLQVAEAAAASITAKINDDDNGDDDLEDMLRADTWVRRVSSLEACFRNESDKKKAVVDEKALESVIMKVISFRSDDRKSKSRESSVNSNLTDDPALLDSLSETLPPEIGKSAAVKTSRPKEHKPKPRYTSSLDKIDARGREFLSRVPDWSEGSSTSGDIFTATTTDDETSVSGNRQRRRRTWSPARRSVSSIEDDDFSDDQFINGCNPARPCEVMSTELRFLFNEVLTRDGSYLNCLGGRPKSTRRRSKK